METIQQIRRHLEAIEMLLNELAPPPPNNVVAMKPEEVELEGIIGRPNRKEVKGKQLFTAGLKITEGNVTRWVALEAWGSVADIGRILIRGDRVRVVGKFRESRYLDSNGVMQVREQFVASLISPVVGVSSATTPSRVSAKSIT